MLMVLLYFIAVMLETGVGVWIFGKMFPKRKEYSKYRIAEKIVLLLSNMLMYTALKGWFKISINIKVIIGVCLLLIVYDIFEKQLNFLNLDCAVYIKIKKYFLFICMLFFLTVQYKGSYLSVTGAISGNTVVPFFLFAFYNCRFIQAYLWEVAYLLNLGLLKILYIFAIGTFNGQTLENGLYNITSQTDPYSGVIWIIVISILAVILQKTIDIGTWMKKLLNKHLFIVGSICFIEGGVSYFLFIFFNATITDKDWIYAFFVVTGLMIILLLISVWYYIRSIDTEKNLLEVRNNMMASQYQQLNEHYREYRCLVHDEKYMINFIEESLKSGDLEEIQQLLCRYKEKFVRKDYWTGISIVDRVITMEKRKMDELDIDFCLNAEVMDIIVDDMDFIILFENLINNAIEAASKCKEKRKIELTMKNVNDTLIFKLWNSNSKLPNKKGKKFLTDKMDTAGHGWGIESVKHIVEKYNGSVHFRYDESFFEVDIII